MKLITEEIKKRFDEVGSQEENLDPIVIAKFFDPCGSATWYATEYDAEHNVAFGYVTGLFEDEWGSFSITELESTQRPLGLKIERDIYCNEKTISQWVPELKTTIEAARQRQEVEVQDQKQPKLRR